MRVFHYVDCKIIDFDMYSGMQDALYNGGIEVPIKCLHGQLYCRISAHVYNVMGDFEALAVAVLSHTPPWRVACRA